MGLLKIITALSFKLDFYPKHMVIKEAQPGTTSSLYPEKSPSISHISECLSRLQPNPYPRAYTQSNLSPSFTSRPVLIFLIASAHFPSLVLISLSSSSEPLSLPSSLTVLLNHVGFFLVQSISFPSSVIASFCPPAPGFCMVVFTTVLLPPRTHSQTHTNSRAHAHPRLFSACCRGDKWLLCCLATGWQSLGGKRSI